MELIQALMASSSFDVNFECYFSSHLSVFFNLRSPCKVFSLRYNQMNTIITLITIYFYIAKEELLTTENTSFLFISPIIPFSARHLSSSSVSEIWVKCRWRADGKSFEQQNNVTYKREWMGEGERWRKSVKEQRYTMHIHTHMLLYRTLALYSLII